jgi:hypothetical protein
MSPALNLTACSTPIDRRRDRRFPIAAYAECLMDGRRTEAATTDISSGGILVQSADILPIGANVELRVDWPSRLDGRCPLRLVVAGKVLRTTARGTVISIARYEYRLDAKARMATSSNSVAPKDLEKELRRVSSNLP